LAWLDLAVYCKGQLAAQGDGKTPTAAQPTGGGFCPDRGDACKKIEMSTRTG